MEGQSLISQSDIQETFVREFVGARKTPKTETVIDGHANDRLANLDRLLDDEREIVALVSATT